MGGRGRGEGARHTPLAGGKNPTTTIHNNNNSKIKRETQHLAFFTWFGNSIVLCVLSSAAFEKERKQLPGPLGGPSL